MTKSIEDFYNGEYEQEKPTKIGCVQHDCDNCAKHRELLLVHLAKLTEKDAEIERLKESAKDFHDKFHFTVMERDVLQARLDALEKQEPVAWERKWSADGETPEKVKNENGRWVWPVKFKLLPATKGRCLPDDEPLFRAPVAQPDQRGVHRFYDGNGKETLPEQPAEPGELSYEHEYALCEANCNAASQAYFKAHVDLDTLQNIRVFEAGHRMGWMAAKGKS